MLGTMTMESRRARGPKNRLARKIERKQRMIEEYERIAHEGQPNGDMSMREFFLKRASDFRAEKKLLEEDMQALLSRRLARRQNGARRNDQGKNG